MATKRLIDPTHLIDECRECMNIEWNKGVYVTWAEAEEDFMNRLLDAPTVDAVEVVHGRWNPSGNCGYRCSNCDFWVAFRSLNNYCPNCGAKMDGDGNA